MRPGILLGLFFQNARRLGRRALVVIDDTRSFWWLRNASPHAGIIEASLRMAESKGIRFGGWALSKSAIRHLCAALLAEGADSAELLEFGGGSSTRFWQQLDAGSPRALKVTTYEHDFYWGATLSDALIGANNLRVEQRALRVVSDAQRDEMFADPGAALASWQQASREADSTEVADIRLHNGFYAFGPEDRPARIDAIVLDGPHGNGRSLAFPLLHGAIAPGTLILIDDFDHYPFVEDLARIYRFTQLQRSTRYEKRWILVRVEEEIR